jgi:hypothetical protein
MSSTTVKAIWPNDRVEDLQEFKNAYGAAMAIWVVICEKYLGDMHAWRPGDDLWPLWKDDRLPKHQRAVLAMTYDNVMIMKADYAEAASDIRAWLVDFPAEQNSSNHWDAIATIFETSPDCPAIGFHQTSVTADPWRGDWDDDAEVYGPPAWEKAWSLYDGLNDPART